MLLSCGFHFLFWLTQRMMRSSAFLLDTQTGLQILQLALWLWSGKHTLIKTIMKHHRNFFSCFVSQITKTMRSTLIILCVMAVVSDLTSFNLHYSLNFPSNSCLHMCHSFYFLYFLFFFCLFFVSGISFFSW